MEKKCFYSRVGNARSQGIVNTCLRSEVATELQFAKKV